MQQEVSLKKLRLNELFLKARSDNPYRRMLKEKSKILTCLVDNRDLESDRNYFTPVFKLDPYIFFRDIEQMKQLSREAGMEVTSFDDWLELTECMIERAVSKGIVVIEVKIYYLKSQWYF